MKREVIRVEPLSTLLERRKAPASVVVRHGETMYVSVFRRSTRRRARSSTHRSSDRRRLSSSS